MPLAQPDHLQIGSSSPADDGIILCIAKHIIIKISAP